MQEMGRFSLDTMQDSASYIQCMVDEFLILQAAESTEVEVFRNDLSRRLTNFELLNPNRFKQVLEILNKPDFVFLDNPLLAWMAERIRFFLFRAENKEIPAWLIREQLPCIENHLPPHVADLLNVPEAEVCRICRCCDGEYKSRIIPMGDNTLLRRMPSTKPTYDSQPERNETKFPESGRPVGKSKNNRLLLKDKEESMENLETLGVQREEQGIPGHEKLAQSTPKKARVSPVHSPHRVSGK